MPKVSQEVPKIIQKSSKIQPWPSSRKHAQSDPGSSKNHPKNYRKSNLTPPKSRPRTSWTLLKSKFVFRTILWELQHSFLDPFFRILKRLGSQDGSMLEAKTEPKSIKIRYKKAWKFEGLLELPKIGKSSIFERNMEASWHQNRSRNQCYLRKAVFWKNLVFPPEKHTFLRSRGSKLGTKIDLKSI